MGRSALMDSLPKRSARSKNHPLGESCLSDGCVKRCGALRTPFAYTCGRLLAVPGWPLSLATAVLGEGGKMLSAHCAAPLRVETLNAGFDIRSRDVQE